MKELESGKTYALFIIPEDFSSDVTTLLSGDFKQPQLEYYVNEKLGPVSPKITDTGASTLDTTINDAFVSTVSSTVASVLNQELDKANANAAQVEGRRARPHRRSSQAGIAEAREALTALSQASSDAVGKTETAKTALAQAKEDVATLSLALSNAAGITASANTQIVKFSTSMGTVLDQCSSLISRTSTQVNDAVGKAASSVTAAQGEVDAAIARGQAVVQENEQVLALLQKAQRRCPMVNLVKRSSELSSGSFGKATKMRRPRLRGSACFGRHRRNRASHRRRSLGYEHGGPIDARQR